MNNMDATPIMLTSGEAKVFADLKSGTPLSRTLINRIHPRANGPQPIPTTDDFYTFINKTPEQLLATYTLKRQTAKTRRLIADFQADIQRRTPVVDIPLREYAFRKIAEIAQEYQALVSVAPKNPAVEHSMKSNKTVYSKYTVVADTFGMLHQEISRILNRQDQRYRVHIIFETIAGKVEEEEYTGADGVFHPRKPNRIVKISAT